MNNNNNIILFGLSGIHGINFLSMWVYLTANWLVYYHNYSLSYFERVVVFLSRKPNKQYLSYFCIGLQMLSPHTCGQIMQIAGWHCYIKINLQNLRLKGLLFTKIDVGVLEL